MLALDFRNLGSNPACITPDCPLVAVYHWRYFITSLPFHNITLKREQLPHRGAVGIKVSLSRKSPDTYQTLNKYFWKSIKQQLCARTKKWFLLSESLHMDMGEETMTQMFIGPSHLVVENEMRGQAQLIESSPVNQWPCELTVAGIPRKRKISFWGQYIKLASRGEAPSYMVKYKLLDGITCTCVLHSIRHSNCAINISIRLTLYVQMFHQHQEPCQRLPSGSRSQMMVLNIPVHFLHLPVFVQDWH